MNISKEVAELRKYRGAASNFLQKLLSLQIHLAEADAGVIIKLANGKPHILASSVDVAHKPEWLTAGIEQSPKSLRTGEPVFVSLGGGQKHAVVVVPFPDTSRGTLTILTGKVSLEFEKMKSGVLSLPFALLDNYEARMTLKQRKAAQDRIHQALDMELVVNRKSDYQAFCLELCNEVAAGWNCSRVSIGLVVKGGIKLKFMSHSEKFSRKMKIVRDLESAMEECADQDRELVYPPISGARYIYRQLEVFSVENDNTAIITIPFHHSGEVEGVLMLERKKQNEFSQEDLETLRLIADLISPRLLDLEKHNSWLHRTAEVCKRPLKILVSRQNTFAKLMFFLAVCLTAFLTFARGEYNIEGSFRMEVFNEKTISAPFEGILMNVKVKPGDKVKKGQLLAQMDTLDLKLKLQELEAEILNLNKEYSISLNERNMAKSQIARAKIKGVEARKKMTQELIKRGQLIAPVSGVVLSEDLTRLYRAPVKRGDELFVIGKVNRLEAVAYIPEDQIPDLTLGMDGNAALAGRPEDKIPVKVKEISSIAEVKDQQNVFKVKMFVAEKPSWLRPGMEGLVKVKHGERALIWIWSRKAINWVRMKLWI
ncbi:MAG: efflux RND transporter periplasmic adaptor subunit [Lentisphaeraceae bacterium]|nr:efflux RND transporter periplasmic adaptor subunit [Lentisphaeraceae bacterium]